MDDWTGRHMDDMDNMDNWTLGTAWTTYGRLDDMDNWITTGRQHGQQLDDWTTGRLGPTHTNQLILLLYTILIIALTLLRFVLYWFMVTLTYIDIDEDDSEMLIMCLKTDIALRLSSKEQTDTK